MKTLFILPAILLMTFAFSISVQSQTLSDSIVFKPEAEHEFVDAMKSFKACHYDTASALFTHMLNYYPRSHRTTGAFIMGAKTFYELNDFRESIRLLKNLIDLYPQSAYVDDAHYTLALNYFRTGRYEDAASECIEVLQTSQEKQLNERSEKIVEMLTSTLPDASRIATASVRCKKRRDEIACNCSNCR